MCLVVVLASARFRSAHPSPSSLSISPFQSPIHHQQTKRAQIAEVAGKAQAKVQELVGEAKK